MPLFVEMELEELKAKKLSFKIKLQNLFSAITELTSG